MNDVVSPDPDHAWLKNVYGSGIRQLTPRAVVVGMILRTGMCLSNLYVILKTGWSLGVTVMACILGFGLFRAGYNSTAMFFGGSIAEILRCRRPALAERGVVPVASGFMAGESSMGVLTAVLVAVGILGK